MHFQKKRGFNNNRIISSSLVVDLLMLALVPVTEAVAVSVSTEAGLHAAIVAGNTVELAADIDLSAPISIDGITGLVIDGNGHKIDGQGRVRCFYINNGAEVKINKLKVTGGFDYDFGGAFYLNTSSITVNHSHVFNNSAVN